MASPQGPSITLPSESGPRWTSVSFIAASAAGSGAVAPSRLTLVTSDPAYTPDRTLMVSARLRGKALPASTGTTAPPADQPGHGSTARLVPLLLWSQLLLVTTLVVTWAALRMPRRGLWIGATPVLLAILWQVFENLAVLLPNTL